MGVGFVCLNPAGQDPEGETYYMMDVLCEQEGRAHSDTGGPHISLVAPHVHNLRDRRGRPAHVVYQYVGHEPGFPLAFLHAKTELMNHTEMPLANLVGHGDVRAYATDEVRAFCKAAGLQPVKLEAQKKFRLHLVAHKPKDVS